MLESQASQECGELEVITRRRSELTAEDIALAYELSLDGCCWKRIAVGLNCYADDISAAVRHAIRHGVSAGRRKQGGSRVVPIHAIMAAKAMRECRMGWKSIAEHLCMNRLSLRVAFNHYYSLSS
jgi:hypothetical protein